MIINHRYSSSSRARQVGLVTSPAGKLPIFSHGNSSIVRNSQISRTRIPLPVQREQPSSRLKGSMTNPSAKSVQTAAAAAFAMALLERRGVEVERVPHNDGHTQSAHPPHFGLFARPRSFPSNPAAAAVTTLTATAASTGPECDRLFGWPQSVGTRNGVGRRAVLFGTPLTAAVRGMLLGFVLRHRLSGRSA